MEYKFNRKQLETLQTVMEIYGEWGPRPTYRHFHQLPENAPIETSDVEDFIIAFMSQYNAEFGITY